MERRVRRCAAHRLHGWKQDGSREPRTRYAAEITSHRHNRRRDRTGSTHAYRPHRSSTAVARTRTYGGRWPLARGRRARTHWRKPASTSCRAQGGRNHGARGHLRCHDATRPGEDGEHHRDDSRQTRRPDRARDPLRHQAVSDFRFLGANDGASSTAAVLELGRGLKARQNDTPSSCSSSTARKPSSNGTATTTTPTAAGTTSRWRRRPERSPGSRRWYCSTWSATARCRSAATLLHSAGSPTCLGVGGEARLPRELRRRRPARSTTTTCRSSAPEYRRWTSSTSICRMAHSPG